MKKVCVVFEERESFRFDSLLRCVGASGAAFRFAGDAKRGHSAFGFGLALFGF